MNMVVRYLKSKVNITRATNTEIPGLPTLRNEYPHYPPEISWNSLLNHIFSLLNHELTWTFKVISTLDLQEIAFNVSLVYRPRSANGCYTSQHVRLSCVTMKFDRLPWKKTKVPLLCHFKLCAPFHRQLWIESNRICGPEMPKLGPNLFWLLWSIHLWHLNPIFCMSMVITLENFMIMTTGTLWKRCDGHRWTHKKDRS